MAMREIKFRAWDENYKEMMFWGIGDVHGDGSTCTFPSGNSIKMPQMQYTGLKDKNGVDTYEGDIIPYCKTNYVQEYAVVVYNEECTGFYLEYENCLYSFFEDGDYEAVWFEVIGNIYENKELLEQ